MKKEILVGIDLGTTTLKAVFINAATFKFVTVQVEEIFPLKTENPDWLEYDPKDWFEGTKRLLRRGFDAGVDPDNIGGICFTGWTVMALFADENGVPVTNAIHYNDMRHVPDLEELQTLTGEDCVRKNGNYIGMYNGLAKHYWWKKHRPDILAKADCVHTEASWMIRQLTGKNAWNRTEAGFYGQYNAHTREWDDEIIRTTGFSRSLFPRLYDAWEIVGEVTGEAAMLTGFAAGTPVVAGADDSSTSALITGAIKVGQSNLSGGSASNIAAVTTKPVSHPTILTFPHCIPGMTAAITVMSSTALSNKWARNALCQAETAVASITGSDPYDYMNDAAQTAPPGANGLIFLPYLDGDFTPNNDPNARGCLIGMDAKTTKADILRAVLEGMAFSILDNINLIREVGVRMEEIFATGGMTKSRTWMQIISDVTGCSISLPEETEGTPFGGALIAGLGTGLISSFDEAISKMVKVQYNAFTPNPECNKLYQDLFQVYKALYPSLKGMYTKLQSFRETYCQN
ncbi:MAG: hypothetical protein LBH42_08630 [Treponema sp.]|jgi:xylulokinase|nr:hypothetical protein [Treponema sp.]